MFRTLFQIISKRWHMYPLGLLFGLGFDTTTEIGLLGIAAAQAAQGIAIEFIFPVLFTAGMALVDTTDGVFMVSAYGWAFANPIRKLWYNLTRVSVLVALLIGNVEIPGLLADELEYEGGMWTSVRGLKDSRGPLAFL